jgi:eukaryotic-like serine/threonine-protein kinase
MTTPGQFLQQGRYHVLKVLGHGGMGSVYLANDRNLPDHQVAIKENEDTGAEAQKQFEREAVILARLRHDNLPRVTDHFVEPSGRQYLVMDYIPGNNLRSLVRSNGGPIAETSALAWIEQVLRALEYMHNWRDERRGDLLPIVHRDIKPHNIILTGAGRIVLVDFGLAKYTTDLTNAGARAVSPSYSPPEQYAGRTDVRSDIYALGATLYFLLTGEPPLAASARTNAPLTPPRRLNPAIAQSTEDAILQALQFQAAERFQTAGEMRSALFGSSPPSFVATPPPENAYLHVARRAEPEQPADPPPANDPTKPALDLRRLFEDGVPQILKDGTAIVPVRHDQEIRIEVASAQAPALRKVAVKMDAGVGLLLRPWRPKPMAVLAPGAGPLPDSWAAAGDNLICVAPAPGEDRLVAQVTDWPAKYHSWEFELLGLGLEYPLAHERVLCLYLDRDQIAAAWRIWHQGGTLWPETFLLLLGKSK